MTASFGPVRQELKRIGLSKAAIDALELRGNAGDGITPTPDTFIYYDATATPTLTAITAYTRSLLDDADAEGARATLDVYSTAEVDTLFAAALPADADYGDVVVSGSGAVWTFDSSVVTAAARTVLDDTTTAAMLTTLGGQPLDADLTALAALSTTGLVARTGAATYSPRTLTAPAAGITVSNGDGVSGNPTLVLANDLGALEALTGTDTIYYRSGVSTWSAVTVSTGLSFSGGVLTASGGYTDEQAQDAVGTIVSGTGLATVTYADATPTIITDVPAAAASDLNTGTNTTKAVTADAFAGSTFGRRVVEILVTDPAGAALTTGDGKAYFRVPIELNGMDLVAVGAAVTTAGTATPLTIQIANVTQAADMLTTKITVDATETDSSTAAAAVIDTANDDVATGDMLRIDFDGVPTGAKGAIVCMSFALP